MIPYKHCTSGLAAGGELTDDDLRDLPLADHTNRDAWHSGIRRAASQIADHRVGGHAQRAETQAARSPPGSST